MGSTRHEKSFVDFEQPYEQNIIGLKGIIYFGVGLFLLIVITFGLMWALMDALEDNKRDEMQESQNPMALGDRDRIPPEPRLQVAPGFNVETAEGTQNLELRPPQAEYWELRKQWELDWKNGVRDTRTGVVTSMPIDQAKEAFLQQNANTNAAPEAQKLFEDSRTYFIDSSSGRMATLKRQ